MNSRSKRERRESGSATLRVMDDPAARVFVKYDRVLHGDRRAGGQRAAGQLLTPRFLRKYIKYCKDRFSPKLGAEACTAFTAAYTAMRLDQTDKTLPVTARTL